MSCMQEKPYCTTSLKIIMSLTPGGRRTKFFASVIQVWLLRVLHSSLLTTSNILIQQQIRLERFASLVKLISTDIGLGKGKMRHKP